MRHSDQIAVSLASVYNKINGVAPATAASLVRESGLACAQAIDEMGGRQAPWLKGYPIRIVDGNCVAGSEHRLKDLRKLAAGALPGKALVVYDPERACILNSVLCEDAHTQERALLDQILTMVNPGELWIEDRNFCTRNFIVGVTERDAFVVVREHKNLPLMVVGRERRAGKIPTGLVNEQEVELQSEDGMCLLRLRRVIVKLKHVTRDGDRQLTLLTNLPAEIAATKVANLYRGRWRIETAFQELERDLRSEIVTLGYPSAGTIWPCSGDHCL